MWVSFKFSFKFSPGPHRPRLFATSVSGVPTEGACIQMRRHSATANMRVSKWVHPNAKAFGYGEHVHPNAKAFGYGEHVLRRKRNKRRKMSNWKYYGTTHFSFKNSFEAQHLFQQVGQGHAEGGPESDDEERHHHHTVKGDHGFRDPHDVAVPHPGADE